MIVAGLGPDEIDEDVLAVYLYAPDMPDPDLVIRTSGEQRISNFLLWQLAYSELVFVDTLWPEFGEEDLRRAVAEYSGRRRRFGGR
jgi:undecaprenyl diphosphate synthase